MVLRVILLNLAMLNPWQLELRNFWKIQNAEKYLAKMGVPVFWNNLNLNRFTKKYWISTIRSVRKRLDHASCMFCVNCERCFL